MITPSRLFALAVVASASWLACSSSGGSPGGSTTGQGGHWGASGSGGSTSASGGSGGSTGTTSTSTSSTTGSTGSSSSTTGGSLWQPTSSAPIHYHWMLASFSTADILSGQAGEVAYDIDGQESTAADVAAIHAAGARAVCYVDVGSLEKGRPDYASFPASMVGPVVSGWPQENWLLVTAANQPTLLGLMKTRLQDWCVAKGFDAVEPDNLDAWTNISGVSQADNLAYDLAIAQMAHSLGLSIGLKNIMTDLSGGDVATFTAAFDWALNEQCYENAECSAYTQAGSFLPAGKAVFDVEYNVSPDCAAADQAHMNAQKTDLDLVGATASGYAYAPCIPDNQTTW